MRKNRVLFALSGVSALVLTGAFLACRSMHFGRPTVADTARYTISLPKSIEVSDKGCAEVQCRYSTICFSKAQYSEGHVISLNDRGICFNSTAINSISKIQVSFNSDGFSGATLFYGNYCLSEASSVTLALENTIEIPDGNSFFVIQANGDGLVIDSLNLEYSCTTVYESKEIPQISVTLEEGAVINSREKYQNAQISVTYPDGSFSNLKNVSAGIRLRGNSTSLKPKKPYRIKFDKKQSMFGLEKNKNWALLADYMDASKMHNYTALSFANMVRGESEFSAHPHHVELMINGESQGLYLLTEQMDEKPGRMNLGQEDGFFCSLFDEDGNIRFEDFPFMIERDYSAIHDNLEVLDETYFQLELSNGDNVYYSLKYPEREDFVQVDEDGKVIKDEEGNPIIHDEKFTTYFEALKEYMRDIEESFLVLNSGNTYEQLASKVDYESLASYGLVDLFMAESDHRAKSAKLYREPAGKLKFGPVWDYDSCSVRLGYTGEPIDKPPLGSTLNYRASTYFIGDRFADKFFGNSKGKLLMADCWNSISSEAVQSFLENYASEMEKISELAISDNDRWYQNASMVFDNYRYMNKWVELRIPYLNAEFGL